MIVFGGDTIADYNVYEDKDEAEKVRKEQYSKYDCYVIHLPFKIKS
jgi:hypothetical protein